MDSLRVDDPLSADWMVALFLLVVGVLAWINMAAPKKWRLLTGAVFSLRLGKQSLRDELDVRDRSLIVLMAMAMVLIALYAYQVVVARGLVVPGIEQYGRILLVLVVFLLFQLLLLRLVGVLADDDHGLGEYFYTTMLFHIVLGLVLVPVTAVIAFPFTLEARRTALIVGGLSILGLMLFRWLRAVVIGVGEGVPVRFIFLYLCGAEVLPVALLCEQARRSMPAPSNLL
ncbi:MAG: DUF4271 domain-containing protein [Flavobacteriales bacterium]